MFKSVDATLVCGLLQYFRLELNIQITLYKVVQTFKSGCNPSVWLFKWKLLSSTFKWCRLLLTILQLKFYDFPISFEFSTRGSERFN